LKLRTFMPVKPIEDEIQLQSKNLAGPLEEAVIAFGEEIVRRVEIEVEHNVRLLKALAMVWCSDQLVRSRIDVPGTGRATRLLEPWSHPDERHPVTDLTPFTATPWRSSVTLDADQHAWARLIAASVAQPTSLRFAAPRGPG
jgi:hypothetical protein